MKTHVKFRPSKMLYRFNLHGSFIFQIIFVACWVCAYLYMVNLHQLYDSIGTASSDHYTSAQANITFYGYGFVVLNIIQGAFIMCYHCLQNERVSVRETIFKWFDFKLNSNKFVSISIGSPWISEIRSRFLVTTVFTVRRYNERRSADRQSSQ